MPPWDGEERRQHVQADHDAVIEYGIKLSSLSEAIKAQSENFEEFKKEEYLKYKEKNENWKRWIERIIYISLGFLYLLNILIKYYITK